jgi:hypothetical protein
MPVVSLNREAALEGRGAPLKRFRQYFWTMNSTYPCWCGETELADFSPDSFVLRKLPDPRGEKLAADGAIRRRPR